MGLGLGGLNNSGLISGQDHGALAGLADDDHTQYALLAGRSGGQTYVSGTGAGDDATYRATASATDGDHIWQSDPTTERMRLLSTGELLLGASALSSTEIALFDKAQDAETFIRVKNPTSGASARATLLLSADDTAVNAQLSATSSLLSSGTRVAAAGILETGGGATGGLLLRTGAAAPIILQTEAVDRGRILDTAGGGAWLVNKTTRTNSGQLEVSGKIYGSAALEIDGDLDHDGSNVGFYAAAPAAKQTVTGSRGGNAALASLLTGLATIGLITDSSSA